MPDNTAIAELRRKIMKERGIVAVAPTTRKPMTQEQLDTRYPQTQSMKYIELKYGDRLENLIGTGTIDQVAKDLDIDRSTVSKWRKLLREYSII